MAWYRCVNSRGTYNKYDIDNTTLISNIYIDENNGTEVYTSGWSATNFLRLDGNLLVFIGGIMSYTPNIYNAFYDENKQYVGRLTINAATQTEPIAVPLNAKYMRISCRTNLFTTNSYFVGTSN